jgi:hypothetical protein
MLTMDRGTALTVRPRTISPIPAGSRILDDARLDTIAGSLLRIFVRMEKLDASLGHLSRRITDIENLNKTSARRGSSTESTAPEASDDRFLHTGDSHSRRSE